MHVLQGTRVKMDSDVLDLIREISREHEKNVIRRVDESGLTHSEDGPAIEFIDGPNKGMTIYAKHGRRHRLDGPAVIMPSGETQYWIDGQEMTESAKILIENGYPGEGPEFEVLWKLHQSNRGRNKLGIKGELWTDSTSGLLHVFDGNEWVLVDRLLP